jgi:hypothetical protein
METVRSGKRGYAPMDTLHREMLEPALAAFGIEGLSDTEKADFAHAWRRLDPWPDVIAGMLRLKKRFTLVACHVWDLDAAKARGLRTAFVARPTEYGPGKSGKAPKDGAYDVIASDFGDLASRLGV